MSFVLPVLGTELLRILRQCLTTSDLTYTFYDIVHYSLDFKSCRILSPFYVGFCHRFMSDTLFSSTLDNNIQDTQF